MCPDARTIFALALLCLTCSACQEGLDAVQQEKLGQELGCPPGTRAERRPFWYGQAEGCMDQDDQWHGPFRATWANGKPKEQGTYAKGRKQGDFRFYRRAGDLKEQGAFREGQRQGDWEFYEQGRLLSRGHYVQDSKDGDWTYFEPDGRKIAAGVFRREEKTGAWTTWDSQQRRCHGPMFRGQKDGRWVCHHALPGEPIWVEGAYILGQEQGRFTVTYPSGQVQRRGSYENGLRHGEWIDYDEAGEQVGVYQYQRGHMVKGERSRP